VNVPRRRVAALPPPPLTDHDSAVAVVTGFRSSAGIRVHARVTHASPYSLMTKRSPVCPTTCRSAAGAERTSDRTTAARSRGRSPRRRGTATFERQAQAPVRCNGLLDSYGDCSTSSMVEQDSSLPNGADFQSSETDLPPDLARRARSRAASRRCPKASPPPECRPAIA
jgi:hypothetical protein